MDARPDQRGLFRRIALDVQDAFRFDGADLLRIIIDDNDASTLGAELIRHEFAHSAVAAHNRVVLQVVELRLHFHFLPS